MGIIHRTTLTPGKLELLAGWLPAQPWYRGGRGPEPEKNSVMKGARRRARNVQSRAFIWSRNAWMTASLRLKNTH